jgi:hypothetical protein
MRSGNRTQIDLKGKELLSLLFQMLSLLFSIRSENSIETATEIHPHSLMQKVFSQVEADIIPLDRRELRGERRKQQTYIAHDRRTGFSDRRQKYNG